MEKVLTKDRSRKQWLDVLRALAMLMVIYGHFYRNNNDYFYWTGPVKIPLFFVISGYLLTQKDDSIRVFLLKTLKSLVIPWLALSILPELLYIPFKGVSYFLSNVLDIITGEKYWYMPCCIIAELLFVVSRKLTGKKWLLCIVSLCMSAAGYMLSQVDLLRILNTAMVCQSFLLLGLLLSSFEKQLRAVKLWVILVCAAGYIGAVLVGVLWLPGKGMDVQHSRYYSLPLCAAQIVLGCVSLFALAPRIKWYPRTLTFVGRNTLVFYIYHTWGRVALEVALGVFEITLPDTWYAAAGMSVMVCIGCGFGAAVLNWLLPELVGKKRTKKVKA